MNPTLILQAQQRKAQIKNNGTVEQLREVLKACWPEDTQLANGKMSFYSSWGPNPRRWVGHRSAIDLPIILLTDFFTEADPSFTWGQEVSYDGMDFTFVGLSPKNTDYAILDCKMYLKVVPVTEISPIPSKITPEQAAGEMWEMLGQLQHAICLPDQTRDTIKQLLNRIQP